MHAITEEIECVLEHTKHDTVIICQYLIRSQYAMMELTCCCFSIMLSTYVRSYCVYRSNTLSVQFARGSLNPPVQTYTLVYALRTSSV